MYRTISLIRDIRVLFFSIGIIIFGLLYYIMCNSPDNSNIGKTASLYLMGLALLLIIRTIIARNFIYLAIFSFITMYVYPSKLFFFDGLLFSAHQPSLSNFTAIQATLLFSLFLLVVNTFIIIPKGVTKQIVFRKNDFVFFALFLISIIIVLTSKRTGNVYSGDIGEMTSLNEYVIILFLICFVYSNNERGKVLALYFLYGLYSYFAFIAGGRIELVLVGLLVLLTKLQYKLSFRFLIICFLVFMWIMIIYGNIRSNPTILLKSDLSSILFGFGSTNYGVQASNEGDVYWASVRILRLIEEGELSIASRFDAVKYYFLSPVVPSSILPDSANLTTYKVDFYSSGGGGLAPITFYAMFGLLGPIILALFLVHMLNKYTKSKKNILRIYVLLLIITLPRWFAYNPIQLVKFCVWGIICYYLIISVEYTFNNFKKKGTIHENSNKCV